MRTVQTAPRGQGRVSLPNGSNIAVDVRAGLPSFSMAGYDDRVVREVRQVVRAALLNQGCEFPTERITVNTNGRARRQLRDERQLAYLVALALLHATGQGPGGVLYLNGAVPRLLLDGTALQASASVA